MSVFEAFVPAIILISYYCTIFEVEEAAVIAGQVKLPVAFTVCAEPISYCKLSKSDT